MLKKAMIAIIVLFIGFFIYTLFIKEDEINYTENYKTTSYGVEYKNGIYKLKAKEMIENAEDNTVIFNEVQVFYENAFLKGKTALKQTNDDISLIGDVVGENPQNGWDVKGQELNYYKDFGGIKDFDRFNSNQPMEANNSIKKLMISGDYFESSKNFDDILLERNVNVKTDNFEMIGEKAIYKTEILELIGNVEIEIKSLNTKNEKDNSIIGVFPGTIYDTNAKILTATGAYQMFYKEFVINADELIYDENTDILTSKGNVNISGENLYGTFAEASFNIKEDKIYFTGPINATYNNMNFTGDKGVYDNAKETFEVTGNGIVTSEENVLHAERFFYTKKADMVEIFGGNGVFTYMASNRELTGSYAKFFVGKNLVEVPGVFKFKYATSTGENVEGTGEALQLNTQSQKGDANKPVLLQGKDRIEAQKGILDFTNGIHKLKGKVLGDYGDYKISTEEVDYIEKNETVVINTQYTLTSKIGDFKIWGTNVIFDTVNYKIDAKNKTNFKNSNLEAYGTDLIYDMAKKEGKFTKDFYGKIPSNGMELSGNKVDFKLNSFITLKENVKGNHKDFMVISNNVTYYYLEESIVMPEAANIKTKDKGLDGKAEKGLYDLKKLSYTGHNFNGWSEKATVNSDYLYYDLSKDEVFLKENIVIKDKETGTEIKGKEIVYYIKTDIINSKEPLEIKRDNIFISSKSGTANLKDKILTLDKTILTTSNKDRISGDKLQVNLLKNEFKFEGNIDGSLYSLDEAQLKGIKEIDYSNPIRFKGDLTKAFFVQNGDNRYIITRNEIINSSEFYYKDMKLQGDFIEIENDNQKIFAKGNSKLSLESGNKISAESITLDMLKEITNFKNNVTISNTAGAVGGINTRADKAIFRNKDNLVDLEGNIESYKGKTKIQADKGVYDLANNKLNGKGNIFLSLDFETAEQAKQKQKREKNLNEKINKAQKASEPMETVLIDVNQIELKKLHEGVNILWKSSNEDYITADGRIKHPSYKEKDVMITLTATYICEEVSKQIGYKITVKKIDAKTYLRKQMEEELLYIDGNRVLVKNPNEGIKIKFTSNNEKLVDSKGNIKVDDLSKLNGLNLNLLYMLEGVNINKEYRGSYINGKLKFISLPY